MIDRMGDCQKRAELNGTAGEGRKDDLRTWFPNIDYAGNEEQIEELLDHWWEIKRNEDLPIVEMVPSFPEARIVATTTQPIAPQLAAELERVAELYLYASRFLRTFKETKQGLEKETIDPSNSRGSTMAGATEAEPDLVPDSRENVEDASWPPKSAGYGDNSKIINDALQGWFVVQDGGETVEMRANCECQHVCTANPNYPIAAQLAAEADRVAVLYSRLGRFLRTIVETDEACYVQTKLGPAPPITAAEA